MYICSVHVCLFLLLKWWLSLVQVVDAFMDRCAKSIQQVSRSHRLPWEVTLCGWSLDEEEERVVRSQVVALLRHYPPYYWTKWSTFKQRYSEMWVGLCSVYIMVHVIFFWVCSVYKCVNYGSCDVFLSLCSYSSAISEMAIHNTCRGAVQILGNPGNSQNQVGIHVHCMRVTCRLKRSYYMSVVHTSWVSQEFIQMVVYFSLAHIHVLIEHHGDLHVGYKQLWFPEVTSYNRCLLVWIILALHYTFHRWSFSLSWVLFWRWSTTSTSTSSCRGTSSSYSTCSQTRKSSS